MSDPGRAALFSSAVFLLFVPVLGCFQEEAVPGPPPLFHLLPSVRHRSRSGAQLRRLSFFGGTVRRRSFDPPSYGFPF